MTPNEAQQWQRVIRDFVTLAVGVFMLIYETVATQTPNEWIIGAGLSAIGFVPFFRYDEWRRSNGRQNGNDSQR